MRKTTKATEGENNMENTVGYIKKVETVSNSVRFEEYVIQFIGTEGDVNQRIKEEWAKAPAVWSGDYMVVNTGNDHKVGDVWISMAFYTDFLLSDEQITFYRRELFESCNPTTTYGRITFRNYGVTNIEVKWIEGLLDISHNLTITCLNRIISVLRESVGGYNMVIEDISTEYVKEGLRIDGALLR